MSGDQQNPDPGASGNKLAMGCGIGCLTVFVIGCGIVVFTYFLIQKQFNKLAGYVATEERIIKEAPAVPAHEMLTIIERFDSFREGVTNDQPVRPLVLSEQDINTLINHHDDLAAVAGQMQVDIVDNQLLVEVSAKPSELPLRFPFLKRAFANRYVNGTAHVDLKVQNGQAELYLLDFTFADRTFPPLILAVLGGQNLLQGVETNETVSEILRKIEEVKFEYDQIHIVPKVRIKEPPKKEGKWELIEA